MQTKVDKALENIAKIGWSPVSYSHHPAHIKQAIRASGLRPATKQCYANSQKAVVCQAIVNLEYAEGIVFTDGGFYISHAWVVDEKGGHHDLTLNPMPKIICHKTYSSEEVRKEVIKSGVYDPMNWKWLEVMLMAVKMNLPIDLPFEIIEKNIEDRINKIGSF
jgi:hypothetical protein